MVQSCSKNALTQMAKRNIGMETLRNETEREGDWEKQNLWWAKTANTQWESTEEEDHRQ